MTQHWHLAQLNTATALYGNDDPRMQPFMEKLDEINALADASDGFVWRLQDEGGNATDIRATDDPYLLINMSVWESVDALFEFTYKSAHAMVMADRQKWFDLPNEAHQVMWWIPAGELPTIDDALERLRQLRANGPTPAAFTFKQRFDPPA